ncbi:MAG: DNA polymerase III subunit alpha, partial [Candidatus Bipolaricaulis sp.]|nr:DNA polymerase III subunit alpha [Candidatus Bipolaricaulis sp.]
MDSLALTDHGVLSGAVKFYREAKSRGIRPILGCEIYVAPGDRRDRSGGDGNRYYHLVLLAENDVGYRNLIQIVSAGHTEGFYYRPRADKELLAAHAEGLIALSACESGEIPRLLQAGRDREAEQVARAYAELFGRDRFYIEIQHHGTERDGRLRQRLIALARKLGLPLVATSDVHYLTPDDKLAHEVLINIRANRTLSDPEHRTFDGDGYHFRAPEEMEALFADAPDAIDNTRAIAERCRVEFDFDRILIPPFPLPAGRNDTDAYLRELAYAGAAKRYGEIAPPVRERLEYELDVIAKMSYSTYFLIVWDFVAFARSEGIAVGPGRGSAAGSLVAYALGITGVDPLRYNLIFERFLNPDRVSMPDFDIDFCIRGRDRVIEYVRTKYGGECWWERIAQIATYDRMAARSVVRDVGRVLGLPYGEADRIAKLIPFGSKLQSAVDGVVELRTLYEESESVRRVVDIGLRLEDLTRNISTHAAGVVIAPDALALHAPVLRVAENEFVTQYDMTDIEAIGLLKIDFLGLRNLTLITDALASLAAQAGIELTLDAIPFDDEATFALLREGNTEGIFQLEGSGMTGLIRRVQPDRFEDLIALLALYRPGPLESGMADEYVERRAGRRAVTYAHPSVRAVLEETFGLPIYQDQVMLMAQKLAGFTLAQADTLRKAMGKKNKEIMAGLRERFIQGCRTNALSQELAATTFDDMEKFSRYGFNKSHATAYAFISYWTAYLKAHHPTHFMASLLSSVQGDAEKVAEYIGACRDMGIEVLPPDINESTREFAPIEERRIRFGLGAVKYVGENAIRAILAARKTVPFSSFFDLCRRVDGDGLDRETLEALVKSGAFDRLGASRRGLLRHLPEGLEMTQVARRERLTGQQSIFASLDEARGDPVVREPEFERSDLLAFEKELLGLYVTSHPLEEYADVLHAYCRSIRTVMTMSEGDTATIGGRVKRLRRIDTRRGDTMAFVTIEDGVSEVEATVFPRALEGCGALLCEDRLVGAVVEVGRRNGQVNLVIQELFPLEEVSGRRPLRMTLVLDGTSVDSIALAQLRDVLRRYPGPTPVVLQLTDPTGAVVVSAGNGLGVAPGPALQSALTTLAGVLAVSLSDGGSA